MSGDAVAGIWELAEPNGTYYDNVPVAPDEDVTEDGQLCYVTGNDAPTNSPASDDIDGEGYLMHSGFFYKLSRLKTSPPQDYLNRLVIFKWQSYLTFVTGMLLLVVIYYYNAGVLMVDKRVLLIPPSYAIIISLLSLIVFWFVYDLLCKSKLIENNILFISTAIILLALVSFGLTKLFGPKFAILSVGLILSLIHI